MTEGAALLRARLGAALRSLPSELGRGRSGRQRRARRAATDVVDLAMQLERSSPGLALMMQLRARVFEEAAGAARARGFDQVVTVGWGFERDRVRVRGGRPWLIAVEHPAVLGADADGAHRRLRGTDAPATDFARGAWTALAAHACRRPDRKTLFLVEGLSLWGSASALSYWLRRIAESAAPGSEVLMNLLEEDAAARARDAADALVEPDARIRSVIRFGVDRVRLAAEIGARGLALLRIFDSGEIQSMYLGVEDLLVREVYGWARVPNGRSPTGTEEPTRPAVRGVPLRELVDAAADCRAAVSDSVRPRLLPGVAVRDDGASAISLVLPVTALRGCRIPMCRRELATVSLFDGTCTLAEAVATLAKHGVSDADRMVPRVAATLAAHGFVEHRSSGNSHLTVLREMAFVALRQRDVSLACRAGRLLASTADNPAVAHLRAVLRTAGAAVFERDAEVAMIGAPTTSRPEGRAIVQTARTSLRAIARMLGVHFDRHVLVDVSSARTAIPVTIVADADPYTLVHIPLPSYSPSMLCHELTHVLAISGSTWLSEGLAVWMQRLIAPGPCFPDDAPAEERVSAPDRPLAEQILRTSSLHAFARSDVGLARATYREAAAFVGWLIQRCGIVGFTRFFAAFPWHRGADLTPACRAIGVGSLADLEAEWRRRR